MDEASVILPTLYNDIIYPQEDIKVYVYYGSRKGGKTEGIARGLILKGAYTNNVKIFCARECKDEFNTTLMLVFKDVINNDPEFEFLKPFVKFYKGRIEFTCSGSVMWFVGLSEGTKDRVKGIKADYFWFDEAHNISEDTYDFLIPSIREKGSKVFISFNPQYDYDFVAREFLNNPAPNVKVIKINATENPYLDDESVRQIEIDKLRMPTDRYLWKWEGGFKPISENALFDNNSLRAFAVNESYDRPNFTRLVIGVDPATTSKDYSNESGIVLAGLTKDGKAMLIKDASGCLKPNEMASTVSHLYHTYDVDAVVVEVNQGGDFLKSTILGYDSSLRVIEVRAKQDKIKRMLPIANEVFLGRIKGLDMKSSEKVITQFRKFTSNGYTGSKGESPDRAEAFAWACFELLGISEYGTKGGVFKPEMLVCEIGGFHRYNIAYFFSWGRETALFLVQRYTFGANDVFNFVDCRRFENTNIEAIDDIDLSDYIVAINDNPVVASVVKHLNPKGKIYTTKAPKEEVNQQSDKVVSLIQNRVNLRDCKASVFNGVENNILQNDLLCYYSTQNENEVSVVVRGFCALILSEFRS